MFQAVADADLCFYLQAEGREALAEAIDVDVEALRVEGDTLAPGIAPEFFGEDEPFDIPNQARDDEKFFERELERMPAAFDVVIGVLDAQIAVVINIGVGVGNWMFWKCEWHQSCGYGKTVISDR